jgi:hypothetical protein
MVENDEIYDVIVARRRSGFDGDFPGEGGLRVLVLDKAIFIDIKPVEAGFLPGCWSSSFSFEPVIVWISGEDDLLRLGKADGKHPLPVALFAW